MKKIGILGGTFNPPHIGHLIIANEVGMAAGLDEVWFMPNQEPPHKEKSAGAEDRDRLAMLQLATKGNRLFKIQSIELERPGPSYTADTMDIIKKEYPKDQFYFIIGADMVEYLPKWHRIDELLKKVTFIGVERPGYSMETEYEIMSVDVPEINISSSMVRSRLRKGETVNYLVPEEVVRYIRENQLYGP
ncbi:nicotinic acid mononucleotide adenylyltransferase [Bacillus sp. FJAT-27225]|uniref:nicotinate-nucleotide adenylyltransferase n=1 Tax=Bacillus sp. FJAT-27225 TaxID=1743144 RepID=UPI00080C3166|nr:nicotinate-nucleotide adenylyltransferase [Bacillus sp. FJAT-27225]OCA91180.1 nicotinic acid mononucleotide adenylyltransferase [Bacillus sp. FJAT-27225]